MTIKFADVLADTKNKERQNLLENLARSVVGIDNEIAALQALKDEIAAAADNENLTLAQAQKLCSKVTRF